MVVLGSWDGGAASEAMALNDSGTVVGSYTTTIYRDDPRAWVYKDGILSNLDELLDGSGAGWELQQAFAVDNKGVIAGYGHYLGEPALFLATPR